jgi:hypothetical protein
MGNLPSGYRLQEGYLFKVTLGGDLPLQKREPSCGGRIIGMDEQPSGAYGLRILKLAEELLGRKKPFIECFTSGWSSRSRLSVAVVETFHIRPVLSGSRRP